MSIQDFFLASLCSALILTGSCTSARAALVERVEAVVNKKAIYKSDIDRFRKMVPLRMKVDPLFSNDPLAKKASATDSEIVSFLIDETIVVEKFQVNDGEVEQEITGIQGNLHIDRDQLKAAIVREGFTFEQYFNLMRVSIAKRQLIDREIRNKATVSDDDLKAEFKRQHSTAKNFSGAFHISLVKFAKKTYKTPLLAKAEALKAEEELKKGTSFEEMVKKYGDDAASATGGDLGYLSYSEMSPELQKEVHKLGPQKTSSVIETKNEFMIVKVGDVKADVDAAYDKEREALRSKLLEGEFAHQVRLWLDNQRNQNYVRITAPKA